MVFALKRIGEAARHAREIPFDDSSRIVVMSDCHRGDGDGRSDNFSRNRVIFFAALCHYYDERYNYIELGDGEELWEIRNADEIVAVYRDVYAMLAKFHRDRKLYLVYGNHDKEKRDPDFARTHYAGYFPDVQIDESLLLRYMPNGGQITLLHGHQADLLNDPLWKLARFLVRYVWRTLERVGVNDPTSAAKNYKRRDRVEQTLSRWAARERRMLIAGHTHRPVFPDGDETPYFNDGCCVHPQSVTAIEIAGGRIALVRWGIKSKKDGTLYVGRDILEGPKSLTEFL